jgi:hypothetical protein
MFGANYFGSAYLGQSYPQKATTSLAAASTVAFATAVSLTIIPTLSAASTIGFETAAALNVSHPLAATSEIDISTTALLSGATTLSAASSVQFSTTAARPVMTADFSSTSTITVSTTTPTLTLGGIPLSNGGTTIGISTQALLTGLAAQLAASSSFAIATAADIRPLGPSAVSAVITFNGVTQTSNRIRKSSLTITDALNEAPNTCEFIVDGTPPAIGTDVKIGLSNVLAGSLIFAGTVQRVDQKYEAEDRTIPSWKVSCQDYTYLINRRLVVGSWTNTSATVVAQQIVTTFAPGFSTAGIVAGLPAITVSFAGQPVMAALAEIANLVGGYTNVDYGKVVRLFITDATEAPTAITGPGGLVQNNPPITATSDESQLRTRVIVRGQNGTVSGPAGWDIPPASPQIPIDKDSSPFDPAGQAITVADEVVTYTSTAPGGQASTVTGNVPAPSAAPVPVLATGQAGGLAGVYAWKVAYANAQGETEVGPASLNLTAPTVAPPGSPPGVGQPFNSAVGPLVGTYAYGVSFLNSIGETLRSPLVSRTAAALAPPATPLVGDGPAAGNLPVGATFKYVTTFMTAYGETLASAQATYIPSALQQASLSGATGITFGGIFGGPYLYGISIVTAIGESSPPNTINAGSGFSTSAPLVNVAWNGFQDTLGRIAPGDYAWAVSYYSDRYGESPLGPQFLLHIGGTLNVRLQMALPAGLPANADGIRVYRGLQGGNPFQLNADFRAGSIPSTYFDVLSQGECGNQFPLHPIRAGQAQQWTLSPSAAPGVLARRIYRTKAGGSELFLVGEVQNNLLTTFTDSKFDADLIARSPVSQTTGRQCSVVIATSPRPGVTGRRIYRTQANGSIFYMIAEIKDNTTTTFADNIPDSALTTTTLSGTHTAGGEQTLISSVPVGPAGTLARKIYRTVAGGTELQFLGQISDNTTLSFLDTVPDANLGQTAPLLNTAGASAVNLTNVPTGGAGVTQRIIYRTAAGGLDFKYVGTINDNSTTTYLDDKADSSLGRLPQATSTIGALAGDASVLLQSTAGWPTSGWFDGDGQIIRYNGISGNALTGIPPLLSATITRAGSVATATAASPHGYTTGQRIVILGANQPEYTGSHTVTVTGPTTFTYDVTGTPQTPATGTIKISQPGAIIGALAGGVTVQTIPMLTGVTGLTVPIAAGSQIALWVVRNSTSGQSTIAASEGGDGVHEFLVTDGSLDSVAACQKRADAELALFQFARVQVTYTTRDTKTRSGKTIHIALGAPQNISGDFLIQNVTITQIDQYPRLAPLYAVTASNTKFSLQDVLRHVVLDI